MDAKFTHKYNHDCSIKLSESSLGFVYILLLLVVLNLSVHRILSCDYLTLIECALVAKKKNSIIPLVTYYFMGKSELSGSYFCKLILTEAILNTSTRSVNKHSQN